MKTVEKLKILKMKKLVSILIAVFCISLTVCISKNYQDDNQRDDDHRKLIIIIAQKNRTGIERSIPPSADASLNLLSDIIELEIYNMYDGEVYIIDSNNMVVNSSAISYGLTYMTIAAPETAGNYVLVIDSSNYYGEGYFTIE